MLRLAVLAAVALGAVAAASRPTEPTFHPHFQKKIEVALRNGPTLTVSHITVTLDEDGAAAMAPGGSWHLGNCHLETSAAVEVGGVAVAAGKHSIKARKTEGGGWELVLDGPGSFQRAISDAGKALATRLETGLPACEHLSVDIQPSGDKSATKLYLDVRWGEMLARSEIVVPEAK